MVLRPGFRSISWSRKTEKVGQSGQIMPTHSEFDARSYLARGTTVAGGRAGVTTKDTKSTKDRM